MKPPKIELTGVLSRCVFSDGKAEIRLTPFAMPQETLAVWSIVFVNPNFNAETVQPYMNKEVEVEVFEKHAVIYDEDRRIQQVVDGFEVNVTQVDYDTEDLRLYVQTLEADAEHLHGALEAARVKDAKGRSILRELVRRAEIKAAFSDHHHERQAAAIEVLKRLQRHFGE